MASWEPRGLTESGQSGMEKLRHLERRLRALQERSRNGDLGALRAARIIEMELRRLRPSRAPESATSDLEELHGESHSSADIPSPIPSTSRALDSDDVEQHIESKVDNLKITGGHEAECERDDNAHDTPSPTVSRDKTFLNKSLNYLSPLHDLENVEALGEIEELTAGITEESVVSNCIARLQKLLIKLQTSELPTELRQQMDSEKIAILLPYVIQEVSYKLSVLALECILRLVPHLEETESLQHHFHIPLLLKRIQQAIIHSEKEQDAASMVLWVNLGKLLFDDAPRTEPGGTATMALPTDIDTFFFISTILDVGASVREDCQIHYRYQQDSETIVLKVIAAHPRSSATLTQSLVSYLNRMGYPESDAKEVRKCTKLLADLLQSVSTASIFYTNDLKVLLDLMIRELKNLPADALLRLAYLNILQCIIALPIWEDLDRYRVRDLRKLLSQIYKAGKMEGSTIPAPVVDSIRALVDEGKDKLKPLERS